MKNFRITYRGFLLGTSSNERMENELKNFYWLVGQEPENWKEFDGDIEIVSNEPRGVNDSFVINVSEEWAQWTLDYLKDVFTKSDLRYIEVMIKDKHDLSFVMSNLSREEEREVLDMNPHMYIGHYYTVYKNLYNR
jgi:hypothetical protein